MVNTVDLRGVFWGKQYSALCINGKYLNLYIIGGNSSVVKIYIIRPKPGPVVKNATPWPSGWESNLVPLDY